MPGILGKKIGMTRIYDEAGNLIPVTVVQCKPNVVTQVKTSQKDGYSAVVLGYEERKKPKKTSKFYYLREFKLDPNSEAKTGDNVTLEAFKEVESLIITAKTKGKGTQGTVKKFHFTRGPMSHGSHHHREPGSVGSCAKPGRVHKGKHMAGRMGNEIMTRQKVQVASIDVENNLICLKGAVPGAKNNLVMLYT